MTKLHSIEKLKLYSEAHMTKTHIYIIGALLASLSTILQAAGNTVPVIGLFLSPFSTLPILVITILSPIAGLFSYCVTFLMLLFIQPGEVIIFIFTTGLLGLSLGVFFLYLKYKFLIVISSSVVLFTGITSVLFIIQFPLLGPSFPEHNNHFYTSLILLAFSLLYCTIWTYLGEYFIKQIIKTVIRK